MRVINNLLFWNGASEVLIRVIKMLSWIFLARILGPSEFGTFAICFVSTAALFTFMDFGLSQSIQFRINSNLLQEVEKAFFYFKLKLGLGILAILCFLTFSFLQKTKPGTVLLSSCLLGNLIILDQQNIISVYLKSQNKFSLDLMLRLGASFVGVIALILAALVGKTATSAALFMLISSIMVFPFYKKLSGIHFKKSLKNSSLKTFKEVYFLSFKTWITGVFSICFANMDIFIGNHLFSKQEVGMYAASQKVIFVAQFPVAIIGGMLYQGIASDFQNYKADFIQKILYIFKLLLIFGVLSSGALFLFSFELSKLLFGEKFDQTGTLIKNMAFGLLGLYFYPVFMMFFIFYKKFLNTIISSIFFVGVNILIISISAKKFGLEGLALGSSAANLFLAFGFGIFVLLFLRQNLNDSRV